MTEKIIEQLKTKYKTLGFSDQVFQSLAETLAGSVTDESQIETAIAGVENLLKSIQSQEDKRVSEALKKKAESKKDAQPEEPKGKEEGGKNDQTQSLLKAIEALKQEVHSIKTEKTVESRKQTLEKVLEGSVPAFKTTAMKLFDRMKFKDEEDFNSFLEEVKQESVEFDKISLGATGRPAINGLDGKALEPKDVEEIVNEIM